MAKPKARKIRSDAQVKTAEKKLGLPEGSIRNPDGRNTRGDKLVGTLRKEAAKKTTTRKGKK